MLLSVLLVIPLMVLWCVCSVGADVGVGGGVGVGCGIGVVGVGCAGILDDVVVA